MPNPHRPFESRPPARIGAGLLALASVGLHSTACSSPLGGRDIDLEVSARGFPGAGVGVAMSQRMLEHGNSRYDFELGIEEQHLEDEGPRGDEWSRMWCGFRWQPRERDDAFFLHLGATWLRTNGLASGLDNPGDYGGAYFGGGYLWELTPSMGMGPDLNFLWVDSEGSSSGSGGVGQVAWRFVWHL